MLQSGKETTALSVAGQTRDFARRFFDLIGELGREDWVPAHDAFERALAAHPHHPYVAYLGANRARRAGFSAAAEKVRQSEFPQIERRKAGTRRNAPVYYRVARPDAGLGFELPYQMPASHPLRDAADSGSALRRKSESPEARSPWRRRQRARPPMPEAPAGWASLRCRCQRFTDSALALLESLFKANDGRRRP